MRWYRIYKLNQNGRIITGADVACTSDAAAFASVEAVFGRNVRAEIWYRETCLGQVGRSDSDPGCPPPGFRPPALEAFRALL